MSKLKYSILFAMAFAGGALLDHFVLPRMMGHPSSSSFDSRNGVDFSGSAQELVLHLRSLSDPNEASSFVHGAIQNLGIEKVPAFAEVFSRLRSRQIWELNASAQLHAKWIREDRRAAMAWAHSLAGARKLGVLQNMLYQLAMIDPAEASEDFSKIESERERGLVVGAFARGMASKEPEKALQFLKDYATSENLAMCSEVYRIWAEINPTAAFQSIMALPEGRIRRLSIEGIFGEWSRTDPQAAMQATSQLKLPEEQKLAIRSAVYTWSGIDPIAVADWFEALPGFRRASIPVKTLAYTVAENDQRRAARIGGYLRGNDRDNFYRDLGKNWGGEDLESAFKWVQSLSPCYSKLEAIRGLAQSMEVASDTEIFEMVKRFPKGCEQGTFLSSFLMTTRGFSFTKQILEHFDEKYRSNHWGQSKRVAGGLLMVDPESSAKFLDREPEEHRSYLAGSTGSRLCELSPEKALEWAQQLPPTMKESTITAILTELVKTDGRAALAKLELISEGRARDDAARAIILQWATEDIAMLENVWPTLQGQPRQLALHQVIAAKVADDPAAAATYLTELRDSGPPIDLQVIEGALATLGTVWAQVAPERAKEWIQKWPDGPGKDAFWNQMVANRLPLDES